MSTTSNQEQIPTNLECIPKYTKVLNGIYITLVIIVCIGALITTVMPVMSCDGTLIRNSNLPEFSPFGVVPVIMPILLAAVFLSHMRKAAKEIVYTVLLTLTAVCHAEAARVSYNWLIEVTNGRVEYHYGLSVLPIILFLIFLLCFVYEHINFKKVETYLSNLTE